MICIQYTTLNGTAYFTLHEKILKYKNVDKETHCFFWLEKQHNLKKIKVTRVSLKLYNIWKCFNPLEEPVMANSWKVATKG